MSLQGLGKIYKYGKKCLIYVPTHVAMDSAFPFKEGEVVMVEIKGKKIEIRGVK